MRNSKKNIKKIRYESGIFRYESGIKIKKLGDKIFKKFRWLHFSLRKWILFLQKWNNCKNLFEVFL